MQKNLLISALFAFFIFINGCATMRQSRVIDTTPGEVHVVSKGDTLFSIAKRFGVSVSELMSTNGIASPQMMRIGQILFIPDASQPMKVSPTVITQAPVTTEERIFTWPVTDGVVFRGFDTNIDKLHEGLSIGAPLGSSVLAANDGVVVFAGSQGQAYGDMVIVRHAEPFMTIYANLAAIQVRKGDTVKRSQTIAQVGTTGDVESPRVHFQVRKDRVAVNPSNYLPLN